MPDPQGAQKKATEPRPSLSRSTDARLHDVIGWPALPPRGVELTSSTMENLR
ncbi:hypothetical protein AKJ09_04391 [Labilithrix luteola]|uniref:Uncharacterized protein n=1 Tax=Labilithrix luteola TaxID=1391654 RepID=A0A0K1PW35_9BACT|nr:hypothetical protein AKJ09_04391 [Labilithrix luteola]